VKRGRPRAIRVKKSYKRKLYGGKRKGVMNPTRRAAGISRNWRRRIR
jgi:hypothetical protein